MTKTKLLRQRTPRQREYDSRRAAASYRKWEATFLDKVGCRSWREYDAQQYQRVAPEIKALIARYKADGRVTAAGRLQQLMRDWSADVEAKA